MIKNKKPVCASTYTTDASAGTAFVRTTGNVYYRLRHRSTQDRVTCEKIAKAYVPNAAEKQDLESLKSPALISAIKTRFNFA